MREVLFPAGYMEVKTPLVYNKALWETSGHWQHYRENMFLIESEDVAMGREADELSRPHACSTRSEARSYRDLPLRFHEQTPLHRNEASGVLSGLIRVRQFSQDDAHCFVTEEQIGDEVERLLRLVQRVYGDFGLDYTAKLVDPPRRVPGQSRDVGPRRESAEDGTRARRPGLHRQRGRRGVLRAEDRLRRHRRDRPQMAVRDDPARLRAAGALRPEVRRARTTPSTARSSSTGRFSAVSSGSSRSWSSTTRARFRSGWRRVQAIVLPISDRHLDYARDVRQPARRRPASTSSSTNARRRLGIRSGKPNCRKSPTCWSSATRKRADGAVAVRSRSGGDRGAATDRGLHRGRGSTKSGSEGTARPPFSGVDLSHLIAPAPDATIVFGSTNGFGCARSA